MAKYRFRLATLQRLREIHRDELRSKLAEAIQAQEVLDQQLVEVGNELDRLQTARREAVAGGRTDINQLLASQRYHQVLLAQQATMTEQARLLALEAERRRQNVVEADQEVRVLERLHERQVASFRQEELRREMKVLDEVAARRRGGETVWAH